MYTERLEFFFQGWKKGEDENGVRENIAEEYNSPCVGVQEKIFTRSRQGCLNEKLLKKLSMTQLVIRERRFLFLIGICYRFVTHPFPEHRRINGFCIILR